MHELSVLQKTLDVCRRVADENRVEHISQITLEIGELSGYLPYFFTEYFPIFTEGETLFRDTRLEILRPRGEALCTECHAMYNVMDREGQCPKCGSRSKTILGGQQFVIKEIRT